MIFPWASYACRPVGYQECLGGESIHPSERVAVVSSRTELRSSITTHPLPVAAHRHQCAFMAAVAASASSLLLHLPSGLPASPKLHSIAFQVRKAPPPLYKYPIYASLSSPNPSSWDREEQRWLREEQRWLREEKRWIREEQRWNSEREALLCEIADLKLQIEALQLEKQRTSAPLITDAVPNLASILQALKESEANLAATAGRIAESSSAALPLLLEQGEVKEMFVEEIKVQEGVGKLKVEEEAEKKKPSLRMGSEGEGVREMQVCMLQI